MTTLITAFPITAKQIAELTSASSAAGTDYLMAQQGATGTAYRKMTVAQVMGSGAAVVASGVTVNAATIPANGLYLPAANTLGLAVNTVGEVQLTASALSPITSDGNALGTTSLMWADLFLASGGVINWANGTYTLTQSLAVLISNGQFLANLNATTAPANLVGTVLRAAAADSISAYFLGDAFGGAMYFASRRSGGTNASPTALASGNIIGGIIARGHDGSAYSGQRASVVMRADEAWTGSAHGTAIVMSMTKAGTTSEVASLTLNSAGAAIFGASGNTLSVLPSTTGGTAIAFTGGSTGGMTFGTSGGVQFAVGHTASAVNYVSVTGGATGTGATVSALGSDSNINLTLTAKGTGVLSFTSPVSAAAISATGTLNLTGTGSTTSANGGVFLKTVNNSSDAPVFRAQGRRNDPNNSIAFSGQFVAEHVRTDALPASGQVFGGLVFGGNVDLSETMTYTASVTAEADGAWVNATNAPTALDFSTGIAGQNLSAPNISYGTRRMRITSAGLVGINTGTAVPLGRLQVSEASAAVSGVTSVVYSGGTQTTANTGTFTGFFSRPQYTAVSGNTLVNLFGAYLNPENVSTGAVTSLFGAYVGPGNTSSGTVGSLTGVYAAPANTSTGSVTNFYGLLSLPLNSGASTVTNAYGLNVRIDNSNASGVITTAYGVFIQTPVNSGTISTRYGIYQQDTAGSNVLGAPTTFGISGNTLAITANATSGTAIAIQGAGTGGMTFSSSGGVQLAVTETASAVNYVGIKGGATGNGVTVSAVGANTDINLILDAKGAGIISVLDSINLASGKVLQVNSTQVVGLRDTGWTTMTGTPDESTSYATSTVTLAQLAGRVMALQTALTTHGLIGA